MKLLQPFEISLQEKQQRMDVTIEAMGRLVDYEIADVTAAATYYMAETYFDFSRSLAESERPTDLQPADWRSTSWSSRRKRFRSRRRPSTCTRRTWSCCRPASSTRGPRRVSASSPSWCRGATRRSEMSSGFLGAIDSYVYRSPASQSTARHWTAPTRRLADEPAETTHLAPMAVDDGVVEHANPQ